MRLEGLAQRLVDAGLGTLGQNLFIYFMADTVVEGAMLRLGLNGAPIDHELPGYRANAAFQLIVRARRFETGRDRIEALVKALSSERPFEVDGYRFNYVRPRHEPIAYPRSDGKNIEMAVNFDCNFIIL